MPHLVPFYFINEVIFAFSLLCYIIYHLYNVLLTHPSLLFISLLFVVFVVFGDFVAYSSRNIYIAGTLAQKVRSLAGYSFYTGFCGFVIKLYKICFGFTLNLYLFMSNCILLFFKHSWAMSIIFFILNILINILFYLDLHTVYDVFLDEYLSMLSVGDMLNSEAPGDSNTGGNNSGPEGNNSGPEGNNSGPEGNNSGGNDPDLGNNTHEASEDMRNSVESKFRIQYDYNKNVSVNNRPDVYSHEGAGKLNQNEIDYIHRNAHFNNAWHYSASRGKLLRRPGIKAATRVIKITRQDIIFLSRFPKN
jgi:hypothetical protein